MRSLFSMLRMTPRADRANLNLQHPLTVDDYPESSERL